MRDGGINQSDTVVDGVFNIDDFAVTQLPSGGVPSYYHVVYIDAATAVPDCPATRSLVPAYKGNPRPTS